MHDRLASLPLQLHLEYYSDGLFFATHLTRRIALYYRGEGRHMFLRGKEGELYYEEHTEFLSDVFKILHIGLPVVSN